jgi:condensin complex subunit 1
MDNPIFHNLRTAILAPCRSKEWFGMAEQGINTIYALGEHPDMLCNDIIKQLTHRAFNRTPTTKDEPLSQDQAQTQSEKDPDAMDEDEPELPSATANEPASTPGTSQGGKNSDVGEAFELSQLLFVVGHVAIKQIVYLELVERELKRQKDEKQAGKRISFSRPFHSNSLVISRETG